MCNRYCLHYEGLKIRLNMYLNHPWFLIGLSGITIPILIHLLQLRRPQRLLFTNTAFVREIDLVTVRKRRIQHLLLLLLRILALTALVLVFCQPFIPAKETGHFDSGNSVDVLIDNSFSMQAEGIASNSLFEEAIKNARSLGISNSSDVKFNLINNGATLINKAAYYEKLDALRLNSQGSLFKIVAKSENKYNENKAMYLFSDFQKSGFNLKMLSQLSSDKGVFLVPITGKKVGNIYVDSIWLDDAFVRVRTNVGLHIRLKNGGNEIVNDCSVKVFLGDHQAAVFRVKIAPGQATVSVVQVRIDGASLALGRVVTDDAPVIFDNTYYFTLKPAGTVRVLEIGTEPVTQQLYGNEPLFTYAFAKPQNVNYRDLLLTNIVLVREVGSVDAGLRQGLKAVIKRGGSVVIVPSASLVGRDSYQQLFKELGLGKAQWEASTTTPELREVALPSVREPFFRDVFGAQQRTVTMPRVAPVLRWSRTGTDILRLRDGESYLSDFQSGTGQVYVFSAPFSSPYSNFVSHALFVPVMYRMAMLSYRNEQLPAYRLTQRAVILPLLAGNGIAAGTVERADEAGFRFVKDSLTLIPTQRILGQNVRLELPVGMDIPGFYQVQRQGKISTTLAFNLDKGESELAAYSADELREMIGPNRPNVRVLESGTNGGNLAKFRAEQTGQPLWRYFLALALVFLLAETLLLRFGGRQAGAKSVKLVV